MSKIHICFATLDYPVTNSGGGVATVTRLMAKAMLERGHKVSVIRLGNSWQETYIDEGVQVHTITQGPWHYYLSRLPIIGKHLGLPVRELERSYSLARFLRRLHEQIPIDVIEFSEEGVFFSTFSYLRRQCTYVARLHGTEYAWASKVPGRKLSLALRMQRVLQRYFLRRSPHLIGVSEFYKNELIADLGISHSTRIKVLWNPIEELEFPFIETLHTANAPFLMVGRIQDTKGVDLLIKALGIMKREGYIFNLQIAGNYHPSLPKAEFEAMCRLEDLQENVEVLGHVPKFQVYELMKRCRAVVVPSYFETFGLVGIEAIQVGAPLIHSKTGIMKVDPELDSVHIFDSENLDSLVSALKKVIHEEQSSFLSPIQKDQRTRFLQRFSVKLNCNFLESISGI